MEADSARSFCELLQRRRSDGTAHRFRLRQDEQEQGEDEEDDHCDFWNVLALKSSKHMAEASGHCQLGTVGALCLSVISSVAIVICNKALISTLGFTFGNLSPAFFRGNCAVPRCLDLVAQTLLSYYCKVHMVRSNTD